MLVAQYLCICYIINLSKGNKNASFLEILILIMGIIYLAFGGLYREENIVVFVYMYNWSFAFGIRN